VDAVIHSAPLILPVSAPFVRDGALVVRHGRVVATGPRREIMAEWQGEEETRWDGVMVAGLVNAHTHLQYTYMAKVGRQRYASLEEWSTAFDVPVGVEPYRTLIEEGSGRRLATIIGGETIWDSQTQAATDCYSATFRDF
jgi:hypothetical protein